VTALEDVVQTRDELDLVVVLNRFDRADELHRRNLAWLEEHDRLTPITSIEELAAVLRNG